MIRPIIFLLLLLPPVTHAQQQFHVLVTIKPVHSLVSALLADITEPDLLLDGRLSPHGYQLRPSDAIKLAKADMIIWIGPTLESFMQKQLSKVSNKKIIQLTDADHSAGPLTQLHADPHRWLDPQLAITDSQHIAKALITQYPHFRLKISTNLKSLVHRLHNLDHELNGVFSQKRVLSAMLYHDAWDYFTRHFQLSVHGIINTSAHQQPGARHLDMIMKTIETSKTRCLLIEPQFQPRYIDTISKKYPLQVLNVDPLGANQPIGPDAYFDMMRTNASAFAQCQ